MHLKIILFFVGKLGTITLVWRPVRKVEVLGVISLLRQDYKRGEYKLCEFSLFSMFFFCLHCTWCWLLAPQSVPKPFFISNSAFCPYYNLSNISWYLQKNSEFWPQINKIICAWIHKLEHFGFVILSWTVSVCFAQLICGIIDDFMRCLELQGTKSILKPFAPSHFSLSQTKLFFLCFSQVAYQSSFTSYFTAGPFT